MYGGGGGMRWPCRGSMDGRACVCAKKRFSEAQWTLLGAAGSLFPCPVNRTSLTRIDNVGQLANPHKPSLRKFTPHNVEGRDCCIWLPMGGQGFTAMRQIAPFYSVPRSLALLCHFSSSFSSQMNWMNAKSMFRYCLLPSLLFLLQAFVILIEHWLSGLLVFIYKYSIFWFWFVAALTECNLFNLCFSFPKNDAL